MLEEWLFTKHETNFKMVIRLDIPYPDLLQFPHTVKNIHYALGPGYRYSSTDCDCTWHTHNTTYRTGTVIWRNYPHIRHTGIASTAKYGSIKYCTDAVRDTISMYNSMYCCDRRRIIISFMKLLLSFAKKYSEPFVHTCYYGRYEFPKRHTHIFRGILPIWHCQQAQTQTLDKS